MVVVELMAESGGTPWNDICIQSDIPIQGGMQLLHGPVDRMDGGVVDGHERGPLDGGTGEAVPPRRGAGIRWGRGDMDHFACAHGGLHRFGAVFLNLTLFRDIRAWRSGQPKDTQGHPAQGCAHAADGQLDSPPIDWSETQRVLAEGTRVNRDLEVEWAAHMRSGLVDGAAMAALTRHHAVLRDVLGLSTARIEAMLDAASTAGAWAERSMSGAEVACSPMSPTSG